MSVPTDEFAPPPARVPLEVIWARTMARLWVWLCPGAGYAGRGRAVLAVVSFVNSFVFAVALAWFIYTFHPVAAWLICANLVVGVPLWLVEVVLVWLPSSRLPRPRFLTHPPVVATVALWTVTSAASMLVVLNFRSMIVAGGGMAPAINDRERVVYLNRVDDGDLGRRAVIVFRTPAGSGWQPNAIAVGRVAAIPGDRLSTVGGRLVVNDKAGPVLNNPPPRFTRVVPVPAGPDALVVPPGCYFVCSDNPDGGFDSRVLGWAERDRVLSAQVWYLRRDRLLDSVE